MTDKERVPVPAALPVSLRDMVSFQDGSIVSRMLMNKSSGTVTLFAFASGEGLSEHSAPYDALLVNLEGTVEVTIGGIPHTLQEGKMILMPAGIPHAVKALSRFKMMLVMIHE
jgi:quercetin dioxygenase-like cupin family protein